MTIDAFQGEYRFLSNFWPARVRWAGTSFPTVEHAYQAAKFDVAFHSLFTTGSPGQAKRRARELAHAQINLANLKSPDFDLRRIFIMQDLVRQKFNDPDLARRLLATDPEQLIEGNTWHDEFWGRCNGIGLNMLGEILMSRRAVLKIQNH